MFWGAILILFGGLILLNRAGLVSLEFSEYFVPVILIAWGISIILKKRR